MALVHVFRVGDTPAVVPQDLPPKGGDRLRSVPYRCIDPTCGRSWFRETYERVLPPAVCPFCGSPSRMVTKEEDDDSAQPVQQGDV